jgi:Uma2 family endonuclease
MAEPATQRMTVDEFLCRDDGSERRCQLLRGIITMMAPPQAVHGRLVSRLDRAIGRQLREPCEPVIEAGIRPPWRNDTYYQADLAVTCRPLAAGEVFLAEPLAIIEVLSPSTAATDRLLKLDDYREMPSVTDIVHVASDRVRIEHWRREGRLWTVAVLGAGECLELSGLGVRVSLDELFADLPLAEPDAGEAPPTS